MRLRGRAARKFDPAVAVERMDTEKVRDIAADFGVPDTTVHNAVYRFRRRQSAGLVNRGTIVTAADREFIAANWQQMNDRQLARYLGRTLAAVRVQRSRLGLSRFTLLENPPSALDPAPAPADDLNIPAKIRAIPAVACKLHLMDLKNAGYPYGYGEPGREGP